MTNVYDQIFGNTEAANTVPSVESQLFGEDNSSTTVVDPVESVMSQLFPDFDERESDDDNDDYDDYNNSVEQEPSSEDFFEQLFGTGTPVEENEEVVTASVHEQLFGTVENKAEGTPEQSLNLDGEDLALVGQISSLLSPSIRPQINITINIGTVNLLQS